MTTDLVRQQVVSDLRASADLIEKNGLAQGHLWVPVDATPASACPMCSLGAMYAATSGHPAGGGDWAAIQRFIALRNAMTRQVKDNVIAWNDTNGRTAEEVISAFRACADAIESGEAF